MHRLPLVLALSFAFAGSALAKDNDVDKVNGSITAEAGQAYGDLSTVNGSINIADGAHAGDAGTVNGSVKAGNDIEVGGLNTVNGSVRVGTKAKIAGDIETVNGSIFVDRGSRVGKGITSVNGAIGLVGTELAGGIETVSGDITVGVDSQVRGGIKVNKPGSNWLPISFGNQRKPRVIIGPNAVVDGDLVFEREVTLYVHKTAKIGRVSGATAIAYDGPRAPQP